MNVGDAMTARPRCAAPDTPLSQVAELMDSQDVGAIPILDGDRLVGMITDRDIVVRAVAKERDPRGMPPAMRRRPGRTPEARPRTTSARSPGTRAPRTAGESAWATRPPR